MNRITRKQFLRWTSLASGMLVLNNGTAQPKPKPPALDAQKVKDFVGAAHSDANKVRAMLEETPTLLNASWDWGGGDFESGLEAAGHVGNREIAQLLLDKGARMNLFCAAMLGHLPIVRSTLEQYPNLKTSKGPHGLQLLHHAKKGGEKSKEVLAYLEAIGAA